ncbi:MAG: polynucleotide kinase-phosphatase [Isosphaeraceae bacterium]
MTIKIPRLCLVVLIGPSGSGKSTFARRHFLPTEVVSSDVCRGLVSDDENDQAVTGEAFEVLRFIAAKRLALGRLTVVDATNVQPEARKPLVELARQYHCLPVAVVLNIPERVCHERNAERPDRTFGPHVVRNQSSQLRRSLRGLQREGFRQVWVLDSLDAVESAAIERVPLWTDRSDEHGPFDFIGDVHGCGDELEALLERLGYVATPAVAGDLSLYAGPTYSHPEGRKAVFVGDLVDRGPRVLDVLRIAAGMVRAGSALCVPGNHDVKFLKKLSGRDVRITHGLAESLAELEAMPDDVRPSFIRELVAFLDGLISHYVLDDGKVVVAHAGMKQEMQGRASSRVRDFALYGETTGETDDLGLPVRLDWAAQYRGPAMVVYGHTPVPEAEWLNRTVNIDTGCVFGGKLTALRYPEKEFVSVPAARTYCTPSRPFLRDDSGTLLSAQQAHDLVLDLEDVLGKRIIPTRLRGNVTVREENATAALEVMSRFAADPRWLIYLPPTMSPCETSRRTDLLEHPAEAFSYYRTEGAAKVVCEEKHMGSRAVVVVCRDADAARTRFGVDTGEIGAVVTRTGRRFFNGASLEAEFLARVRNALGSAGIWDRLQTTWACLDCELLPWSAKAQELLRSQYAAVGSAATAALPAAASALRRALERFEPEARADAGPVLDHYEGRVEDAARFVAAYRQYCWPVHSLADLKLAPFHLLATEGAVHTEKDHAWHMNTLAEVCRADPGLLRETPYLVVDVTDPSSEDAGVAWWTELTARGGEGMVVKPQSFLHRGSRGLSQPAVKCRGREYLRIIYGPEYTDPEHLARLRSRGLGRKRALAMSEFALGIEALERFVRREPLRRVHECVFGVLALESEPVDPRL